MKKLLIAGNCIFFCCAAVLAVLLLSSCASAQGDSLSSLPESTPALAQMETGAGTDTAAYPLPSNYEKGFQIDPNTGIFHVIESFEQNGVTRYAVLSGIMEETYYLTEQLAVTEGKTIIYEYDLRPFSFKAQRKEHVDIRTQDINFDGSIDLWIEGDSSDYYWLWNDKERTFKRSAALEALELGYPSVDAKNKKIYSYHGKSGENTILRRVFEFVDGVPVLSSYTERVYDETQDKAITTTYELQNGKMCAVDAVSRIIPRYYIDESTNTFSLVQIVPAQQELPPLCITITGELQDGRYYGKEAFVISLTDGTLLQKIYLEEEDMGIVYPEFSSYAEMSLILEDINFDGFLDMGILYDTGASYEWVRYWMWDKGRGGFQLDEALEALHLGEIIVDAKTETFISYYADSVSSYTERTFQYIDGAPVLIRQEEAVYDVERDKVVVTIQERIEGEMEVVEVREE